MKILKYYEKLWGIERRGPRSFINANGEYSLGYQENNYSYSILVNSQKKSSQGYFIVSHNKRYDFDDPIISLQAGDILISRTHSIDGSKMTETLMIESISLNTDRALSYRKMIEKKGWNLMESEMGKIKRVELLKKDKAYCQINTNVSLNDNKNIIVIHIMTEN